MGPPTAGVIYWKKSIRFVWGLHWCTDINRNRFVIGAWCEYSFGRSFFFLLPSHTFSNRSYKQELEEHLARIFPLTLIAQPHWCLDQTSSHAFIVLMAQLSPNNPVPSLSMYLGNSAPNSPMRRHLTITSTLGSSGTSNVHANHLNPQTFNSGIYKRRKTLGSPPNPLKINQEELRNVTIDEEKTPVALEFEVLPPSPDSKSDQGCHYGFGIGQGPRFLLPEIRGSEHNSLKMEANIQKAMADGTDYLRVPFNVPRRRHSWICGWVTSLCFQRSLN